MRNGIDAAYVFVLTLDICMKRQTTDDDNHEINAQCIIWMQADGVLMPKRHMTRTGIYIFIRRITTTTPKQIRPSSAVFHTCRNDCMQRRPNLTLTQWIDRDS